VIIFVEYLIYFLEPVQLMMVYLMGDFEDYPSNDFEFSSGLMI